MKTLHTIYTNFAKRLVMLLILLIVVGTGTLLAQDELVYTLTPVNTGTTNDDTGYAAAVDETINSIIWNITGNSNQVPWRIGGKSLTEVDRILYSKTAITDDISKIVITHGKASSITVNSMTVIVSTIENGGGTVISTLTPTFSADGDVTITRPDGKDWSNAFYKIVYNVTVSSTSNKFIEFTSAKFYKTTAPSTFTVTCQSNNSSYGTVSQASVTKVANNTSISAEGNILTVGTTTVTATPKEQDANYTYAFSNWSGIPDGGKVTENVTVTANFTRTARALTNYRTTCSAQPSYSVTYEANGGETTCEDNTKYEEGDDVMLCDEIPTKENYVFNGWSSDPSVTVTDGKFKMPKSDVTFTAQWSECTGPLITAFNTNGKTDGTYNLGAELGTLSVTAEPSNGGNLIYRWYQYDDATTKDQAKLAAGTNNEATYQIPNNEPCIARHYYCIVSEEGCDKKQESAISGALTLNAIQHTITWSVNGTTQSLSPSSVTDGNNLGTLPTPNLDGICEGKTFVGWTIEANKNYSHETTAPLLITEDTKPNGDVTYYAVFATQEDGAKKTIIFADEWDTNQDLSEHSYFDNAITLSFAKNEGTTAPQYYTSSAAIRLYYDNTMTVTTTTIMQSITFTFVTEDAKGNSISTNPDFGTLLKTPSPQSTESLTHTWNVNTTSVTFTIGKDQNNSASGHCKISQIDVVTGDGNAVTYSNYTTSCTTTYTVDYLLDGGTGGCEDARVEEGGNHTICNDIPTRTGYTFQGWKYNDTETIYTEHTFTDIQADITLVAQWNPITYFVVFDANEGTGTMDSQTFTYDVAQQLTPNTFIRDSYIFAGWATTADGDVVYTDAQSVSNLTTTNGATVTLYAQWSELYTVTFYNMGSVYTTKTQESVGGSITIQETPSACEGYTFDGWSATEVDGVTSYEAVTTITPNKDTQLYAVYSKTEDGGGNATVEDKLTRETTGVSDQTGKTISYSSWSNKTSSSDAVYAGQSAGNNNSIQLRSSTDNDIYSGIVTTTSGGKAKKVTVEWYIGDGGTQAGRTLNIYGKNSAYSAASDLYDNENRGTLLGTIVCGTSTELTIDGDYEYIGLRSAGSAMYFTSITITWATGGPSTTYTTSPDCAEVYNITIDPNIEHGSVTASPMSAVAGTTISLTATPDDTYKFDSWQVTDENSNTIDVTTENTFIMPETDVTVSAIFTEKKRYTITWYANGSEYTTTDVIEDIQIAPPALPNMENYCGVFAGWTTESPVSGNFDETPTLYNEQSEFPLATEETPKTFYAVFADVEGIIPELPKTIAYWEKQQITTESDMSATIGTGIMTSNVNLSTVSNRTYQSNINTEATITLSGLNLTSYDDITLTFWARGSAKGDITITTDLSNDVISTVTLTGTEVLYKINNIPSTATSITLTYNASSGSFFFGTVKLLEAPAAYSFEKLTAENTNGWTGSDWDGYYLITNGQYPLLALDGNAILDGSYEEVEEQNDVIEVPITMAFCVTYDATKSGYSLQGVGDGMFLISKGNDGKEIGAAEKENAAYFPTIGYNQLTTSSNMELSWNTSGDLLRFYNPPKEAPQMYKIMSELSNYRTLCTYDIVLKNNYVDDDSKDGHATITATKTTFNTFTPPTQRPGYTIAGYYAEPECTKKVVEANQTLITNVDGYTQNGQWIGGNVELYTKWQPLIYNLQSGNFFDWGTCSGGNLTLDGSAIGVKYQLYKDDVKYGEEISGTGEALTWKITESGNYTVKSVDPEMQMNGEAVVQLQDPDIVGENTVEVSKTITLRHPGHRDAAGSWVSSNPEIARVDNGIVTGVAAGTVTITFHGLGNCDAHHEVTVVNPEYTMTWKVGVEDENIHATTTIISGNPILLPDPPADNALGCCADKFIGWTTSEAQTISKEDVFTTLAEAQAKFPNITEDKTFYAVFATAAQGVGTSIADFSEMGYENGTAVTELIVLGDGEGHGDATITLAKAPSSKNDAKYYDDGAAVRVYAGSTITISSTYDGATIKSVTFDFSASDTEEDNTISVTSGDGTYSEGTWTGDATAVTFTIGGSTGHRRIASITVTTGVAGSQYTNYVTSCDKMNDPSLGAVQLTYNSGDAIAVNCGTLSSKNSAASITFPNAVNLTCPITVTAPAGFVLATNRQSDTYTQTVVIKPVKTGENKGKITKTVYVRADAPENSETDYSSNITITGEEITETTVTVKADVTCKTYIFKTLTHIGDEHTSNTYYAGQIIEEAPVEPDKDDCSENYIFDGWSTSAVKYGSLIYNKVSFPYTMPAENVTLYPVYICSDNYHRVTSDLGAENWAGDYLIAAASTIVADGSTSGLETINGANIDENIVPASFGDFYYVSLIAVEGGYVLKTQENKDNDKPYVYITPAGNTTATTASSNTAGNNPLSVTYNSESDIVITNPQNTSGYALRSYSTKFGFFISGSSIYLYKKYLYTSSLICETITAEDAMVTSTVDQTVKVNVTATMSGMTVIRDRTLTVESDNTDFAATITETATNTYNVAVNYKPSAEDDTDGTETATITIKVNDNPVTTFQVTGRHLPENFVIAAQWGDNWYALPANCVNGGDSKQGILIDVDDINNPTSATAPTTTKYGLRGVKPGRQADFGQSILFTERVSGKQHALYQNSGTDENIWVSAQYENYDGSNPTYYEWIPSTNDLTNYTFTHSASSRKLGVNENGVFGAYTTDVQVRLLPATFYDQVAVQVIKWKANSVIVMYTGAETTATTQVGTNAATADQTLANQKITHGIYELTTTQSLTENAGKILTMCFGEAQVKVEIPLIVNNGTTTASKNGHDVVILDGGKLTASTTLYSYKNVYVYGGGKLAIPTGTQLGVNNIILRAGGIATNDAGQEATYQYIYPQVDLKGTLTAASQAFLKYEYVTDYDHWYHLVLPFNASLSTITYPQEYYGENVNADNKGSWVIKRYDGATRATGNYDAWKDIEKDEPKVTQVLAGKGYIYWGAPKKVTIGGDTQRQKWGIQRITMNKQAANATNEENGNKKISDLSSYATVEGNSGADNDQGWNLVGNPYMVNLTGLNSQSLQIGQLIHETDASGNWTGKWHWDDTSEQTGLRYVTIPSDHFETYEAKPMTWFTESNPMITGRSFFIQIAGEATDLVFDVTKKASLMPALLAENSDKPVDIETGIVLSNETLQDEMNFWIKDGKTNDYEYNADYPKTPNNNHFNIYGVHTNGDLSWVAISPEFAAESMPIGYQVPAAGTYMLSLSETYYSDDLQALYVTDHGVIPEVTTDLLSGSYEFSVNQAETNNERFTVSVILKTEEDDGGGDVGTGVDNAANNNTPCKFIYQDKMYILRNGVIYDAMGKQVQTINK